MLRFLLISAITICMWASTSRAIGPIEISDRDSSAVLRLQLAAQLLTAWESKDNGTGRESDEALYMKARRIRPVMVLTIPKYKTSFRLHLSTAPGSIELMDFYFNTELCSKMSLRVGQYKIPFTRYRIQSFQRLTFADWSIVTKYFGAERQIGFSVHNGYEKPPRFAYAVGVYSGTNARASHATGLATIYGEKVSNPSDLSESAPKIKFHPEIACYLAYNSGGINVRTDSDDKGGGLRYSVASSVAWDLDPTEYEDLALRVAQEFLVKYRHFSFMGAGYLGFTDVDTSLRTRLALSGILVQSAWRATNRYEFSARYAFVDIKDAITDDALSRAQSITANSNDADLISQYKSAGMVAREHEGTVGFNVYLDGHNLKLQNDFGVSRKVRRNENRTDYLLRSQIQLSF